MSAARGASGAARREQADGRERLGQHLVRAEDAEPFLAQHPDHRGEQPVVAGEGRPADAGEDARALGVGAQRQQVGPAHPADQHEVATALRVQRRQDRPAAPMRRRVVRPGASTAASA